jgi:hypothetical protein
MVVDAAALVVATENESVLVPSGIVTLAGTTTAALLLARLITAPPAGAVVVSVRIAVTGIPPTTELDDSTMFASPAVVGAVVVDESAHPIAAMEVSSAATAGQRAREWAGSKVTDPIVSRKHGENVTPS